MKKAVVCGAGGFIGSHLVKFLKKKGYWVRGVDLHKPLYSTSEADEFLILDLTIKESSFYAVVGMNEVYQLAAQMGGMGFIGFNHIASLYDSNLINIYSLDASIRANVQRYFFSSSACVYPTLKQNTLKKIVLKESNVIPASPNEGYGWEKLVHEVRCKAYSERYSIKTRIARFENCYGPEGTYEGGREKAPAALCRKVILADNKIEVWGDGKQTRSFMYIDDCVKGIYAIMQGDYQDPVNLGNEEVVSINDLAKRIIKISGKKLSIKNIKGPQGVRSRYINHSLAKKLYNWKCKVKLNDGLKKTYDWIESQVYL